MVFRTSSKLLLAPTLLGAVSLALGGGILAWRAWVGDLRGDANAAGATTMALFGVYFLFVAWRLKHYRFEVTEKGLAVGMRAGGPSGLIPWAEIDRLDRYVGSKRGPATTMLYKVTAGKREVAFSSHLFPNHQDLASLIAEHTGQPWNAVGQGGPGGVV